MCKCICRIRSHKQDYWFSVYTFGILAVGKLISIGTNLLFYPQLYENALFLPIAMLNTDVIKLLDFSTLYF